MDYAYRILAMLGGIGCRIKKCFIQTDGVSIQACYKLGDDVPAWVAQSKSAIVRLDLPRFADAELLLLGRIVDPEAVCFINLHQVLPDPDLPYRGTTSKGSLSSISRLAILPAAIALEQGRPSSG